MELHGGRDVEERHASRDGGVEAPFLAHVGPEHPEPVPPFFHDGEHLQGLACVRATPPAPVRRARNAAGIRARPPWSAPTSEFGHVCSANARTRAPSPPYAVAAAAYVEDGDWEEVVAGGPGTGEMEEEQDYRVVFWSPPTIDEVTGAVTSIQQ